MILVYEYWDLPEHPVYRSHLGRQHWLLLKAEEAEKEERQEVLTIIASLLKSLLNWSHIFEDEDEVKKVLVGANCTEVHRRPIEDC